MHTSYLKSVYDTIDHTQYLSKLVCLETLFCLIIVFSVIVSSSCTGLRYHESFVMAKCFIVVNILRMSDCIAASSALSISSVSLSESEILGVVHVVYDCLLIFTHISYQSFLPVWAHIFCGNVTVK